MGVLPPGSNMTPSARESTAAARSGEIVHLTAEFWPYIRTGGLGEAVRGMATFQSRRGSSVSVILPLYAPVRRGDFGLRPLGEPFQLGVGDRMEEGRLWEATKGSDGPRVLFIENDEYFDRDGVYGESGSDYADNHRRFAFLSSAVVELLPGITREPVVLHAHDWHTALSPIYLRTLREGDPFADRVVTVLTVHNGGFQGHFTRETLPEIGLSAELYHPECMEWYGRANILKGGLVFTDMVTTVSPSHAFEMRTEAGGFGLHHTFLGLRDRFVGILNGIDFGIWNPATDPAIPTNYTPEDLSGKKECKLALQEEYELPRNPGILLVAMAARMVAQKGLDLILGGKGIHRDDVQFIFIGNGEQRYEEGLSRLAAAAPERIAYHAEFSEEREHRLIAGADALLMPSLYEPCGLTQMRSQRYGTIPLARRVGGLGETIEDGRTGLLFDEYTPDRLDWTLDRAVARYADPDGWQAMALHAMAEDFSWERVVDKYYEVYERARAIRRGAWTSS